MGKIAKIIVGAGLVAIGYSAGDYMARDSEYLVERTHYSVFLKSKSLDKSYPLNVFNNEVYIGNSDHNLQGVKELAQYEGRKAMMPTVVGMNKRAEDLEKKIEKRKMTDAVEQIGERLRQYWTNFKHGLLDGDGEK